MTMRKLVEIVDIDGDPLRLETLGTQGDDDFELRLSFTNASGTIELYRRIDEDDAVDLIAVLQELVPER